MKFMEIIKKSSGEGRVMDGYRFVGKASSIGDLHSGDIDSFYDGFDGNIERGEDGKLYLVERLSFRSYSPVTPVIWCEVERAIHVGRYSYQELRDRAFSTNATQEDINALGEWFERFSEGRYWNGETHDIDGTHQLRPIQAYDEDSDCWEITGYEII